MEIKPFFIAFISVSIISIFAASVSAVAEAVAVLTTSEDWHYPVLASGFAGSNTYIVVTTSPTSLDSEAQEKIKFVDRIIILGSENVVSADVEQAINDLKNDPGFVKAVVERVGGSDIYETAALLADKWSEPKGLIIVRADIYPDALVGSQLSAAADSPMLFTDSSELPLVTLNKIKELELEVTILGLHVAVSQKVEDEIRGAGVTVARIGGVDGYETATLVGREYIEKREAEIDSVTLVSGVTGEGYGTLGLHSTVTKSVIAYMDASNSMPEVTKDFVNDISLFHGVTKSLILTLEGSQTYAGDREYLEAIGLVSEIKQQDAPAFSLDVAELVRDKLIAEGRLFVPTEGGGGAGGDGGGGDDECDGS